LTVNRAIGRPSRVGVLGNIRLRSHKGKGLVRGKLAAQEATMRTDLVAGSRFPDLVLPDHRRNPVRLSELANGYPLIVSFYRGYW
jgi:hypothetical protein